MRLVMRMVKQRSLRRIRQVLRVAMACSTRARIFACEMAQCVVQASQQLVAGGVLGLEVAGELRGWVLSAQAQVL